MKRSNNVENCLTLSLYFWMLPMAWDCWGSGFPGRFPSYERGETSKVQRNWGEGELEEWAQINQVYHYQEMESQMWKEPHPAWRRRLCASSWMRPKMEGSLLWKGTSFTFRKVFFYLPWNLPSQEAMRVLQSLQTIDTALSSRGLPTLESTAWHVLGTLTILRMASYYFHNRCHQL